jgi:hypothetical protein
VKSRQPTTDDMIQLASDAARIERQEGVENAAWFLWQPDGQFEAVLSHERPTGALTLDEAIEAEIQNNPRAAMYQKLADNFIALVEKFPNPPKRRKK